MKKEIHPTWYPEATVICACGKTYHIGSTAPEQRVEICGHCHPFYTGTERLVDTERRVEKFEKRRAQGQENAQKNKVEKEKKAKAVQASEKPRSLREILSQAKKEAKQ
ncbi:MAG: 50S ribosomal protein L31 [Patescibacteria group bacterium]